MAEAADLLIKGWYVVTMNETRDIIRDGAVVVRGNEIIAVGKASELEQEYDATESYVDERHLAFLTAIERGTSAEVAGMLRAGVPNDVRWDFWSSFSESLPICTRPRDSPV